jgi:2-methylisocitrate lyase-like PEP mutase family enzyme
MPFLIDDILLRALGVSLPPFDMLWLLETITDYVEDARHEEIQRRINDKMKENRLLYELGEMTREKYESKNRELIQQLRINNLRHRKDLARDLTEKITSA